MLHFTSRNKTLLSFSVSLEDFFSVTTLPTGNQTGNVALQKLLMQGNLIQQIPTNLLQAFKNLQTLNVAENKLNDLPELTGLLVQ